MRLAAPLALFLGLLAAGCGGGGTASEPAAEGTLRSLLSRPGPDVALVPGTADFSVGEVRYSFLVIAGNGAAVERPRAEVWVGTSLESTPLVRTEAVLEDVGVPGHSEAAIGDVTKIYVARFRVAQAGKYWVVAQPKGAAIQVFRDFVVAERAKAPEVGDRAIASRTPTLRSTGGDLGALTTRTPPDVAMLRVSVAEALAARVPFAVTFATPKFCTSRTCGPVVDVVDAVRMRVAGTPVRFIHVEIYEDNDPSKGVNRWVKEWRLPSEPWTFLVGRDGRIKARFEGSVSVGELERAIRRSLT